MLSTAPMFFHMMSILCVGEFGKLREFVRVHSARAFGPRIALHESLCVKEAGMKGFAALGIFDKTFFHVLSARTRDPGRRALEIVCLFSVKLKKRARIFEDIVFSGYLDERVGQAHGHA